MIEFKKYSSIENSFSREFMEQVVAEMPQDLEYVVQEKVHGTNTSFLCDGEVVRFAKRTSMLADGEQFYDYPELLERYKGRVLKLFAAIKTKYPEVTHISVFGEMFGGLYPHNGVKAAHKVALIQKGVCYTPEHEFYGFDIYLFTEDGGRFLPVDEVNIHGRLPEDMCLNIPTAKYVFEILEFYYVTELDRYKEIKEFIGEQMKETTLLLYLHFDAAKISFFLNQIYFLL